MRREGSWRALKERFEDEVTHDELARGGTPSLKHQRGQVVRTSDHTLNFFCPYIYKGLLDPAHTFGIWSWDFGHRRRYFCCMIPRLKTTERGICRYIYLERGEC